MKTRNEKLLLLATIIGSIDPIWYVFLLFLLAKGMTYTEAIMLDSITALSSVILEVPSGVIADRYSKKKLVIIGSLIYLINFLILLFCDSYIYFAIGAFIAGIGAALGSGTGTAFIYEVVKAEEDEDRYLKFCSITSRWSHVITSFIVLISSFLFDLDYRLPLIISTTFYVLSLIPYVLVKEPEKEKRVYEDDFKTELKKEMKSFWSTLSQSKLIKLFILDLIMIIVISNINYATQAYLPELGFNVKYLGIIMCVFHLLAALGTKLIEKVKPNGVVWCSIYVVLLLGVATRNFYVVVLSMAISRFIGGFIWVVLDAEINSLIRDEERATILSCENLFQELFMMFVDPIIGLCFDYRGFGKTFLYMAIVMFISIVVFVLIKKRILANKVDTQEG